MNTIIHLSDFHIKPSYPEPSDNVVFKSLVETLKAQNFENLIIVYTGDVIDSKSIVIDDKATIPEKMEQWKSQAQDLFLHASKYFNYLTKELNVDNNHIILAVGNHDVNQFNVETESFDCPIETIKNIYCGKDRFSLISKFLSDLNYQFSSIQNHFRSIDSFNFIIANTQWVDKYDPMTKVTKGLCTNCHLLNKVFEENRNILLQTKNRHNKLHNIFVAHNPERDCCEYSCFDYPEDNNINLEKKIIQYCGIKLFGDKHTQSNYKYDYIVGAPLDSDYITYGIHSFNDKGAYTHKTLNYRKDKNSWFFKQEPESIKEIFECSADYLKTDTYHYLKIDYDYNDLVIDSIIYEFNTIKMSDEWNNLDELFSSFVKLQQPVANQPGRSVDLSKGLFNCVTDILRNTTFETCLTIRGNNGTGKSVFLSALYLNLLYEFSVDLFPCIPIYINIDKIIDDTIVKITSNSPVLERAFCIDNENFLKEVQLKIQSIFKEIESLSENISKKVLIIVDGVKKYYYFDTFKIEAFIELLLEDYKQKNIIKTCVICLDTDKPLNLGVTIFHQQKDSEYIAYFDALYSYNVESQSKLQNFVKAYCSLNGFGMDSEQNILKNIERLQVPQVDLDLMMIAGKKLSLPNCEPIFNILFLHYNKLISGGNIDSGNNVLAQASYLLYFEDYNYSSIKQKVEQYTNRAIDYRLFKKIINNNYLSRILIAIHYCNQLSKRRGSLSRYSQKILNRLYGYDLCIFIIGYIKFMHSGETLRSFESQYYKSLNYAGKSTLTYLIGRIIDNRDDLKAILKKEEEILEKTKEKNVDSKQYYEYRLAKRSINISRMAKNLSNFLTYGNYYDILLSDSYERRINRKFYMQFYGDRNGFQIEPEIDVILNGLDFYYTYQMLATRLNKWKKEKKRSKLLELELFTLCDLVQTHLDCPRVTHKYINGEIVPYDSEELKPNSFFYNERYTDPSRNKATSVLLFMKEIIQHYLDNGESDAKHKRFKQYLHVRQDQIDNAIKSIQKKIPINTFETTTILDDLSRLNIIKKTGWHITDTNSTVDDDTIGEILDNEECFETTLEHVYECLMIGLLYLPDKLLDTKYNKNTVMKMLLIHDLGESYIGDYPPSYKYYDSAREEEDKACVRVFLSGTHEGMANMAEYLNLWNEWYSATHFNKEVNINIRIAIEIDKIQMIYKMFKLLLQKRINLSPKRIADFYGSKEAISTSIGKKIFNILIANNHSFQEIAQNNQIDLREI